MIDIIKCNLKSATLHIVGNKKENESLEIGTIQS